jgi:biotin-dependent carboxylase-like uncharacterized protein
LKAFRIIHPGVHTTVQDSGRFGLMKYGIPLSGAMDQYSYRIGNLLVSNPEDAASFEITVQGLVLEALIPATVAITGADLSPCHGDAPAPQWISFTMEKGETLNFKRRRKGLRAYLAVRGGIDVPVILGSKSTFIRGKIGRPLTEGDIIEIGEFQAISQLNKGSLPENSIPDFGPGGTIRVLMGPQENYYTARGIETFLSSFYTITTQADRMAYRIKGPPIEIVKGPGIISDPIPRGSIQVPGDGQPIILLRDAQVTGGYGKIATVAKADMDRLGQMMPGDRIRFQKISRAEALDLLIEKKNRFEAIKKWVTGEGSTSFTSRG